MQINEQALITVEQLPVIKEQLEEIKRLFETETANAAALVCTEESLQTVKQKRANLTKVFNMLESKRKDAKKKILEPYEEFERIYKECVTDIYKPSDKALADKIGEVESALKNEKRKKVEAYFYEYAQSRLISSVSFESSGITVSLSSSLKSLYGQAQAFIDRLADDFALIGTQDHAEEVEIEYRRNGFNVAGAINAVKQRYAEIERVRAERERKAKAEAEAEARAKAVEETAAEFAPPVEEEPEQTEAPVAEETAAETGKRYSVSFRVIGTLNQIKALKQFLTEGAYEFSNEQ